MSVHTADLHTADPPSPETHTHKHTTHAHHVLFTLYKINTIQTRELKCNLRHPVCLPRHHQQPLPRFGLPWLQGGRCWAGAGRDGGWLRGLSGSSGGGGSGGSRLGSRGGGRVPFGSRHVRTDIITPLPLVAFGALAGVGRLHLLPAIAPAAVSMETGTAGTRVCEKLK